MFKVNNRNTRASCEICSKLTIKTPSAVSVLKNVVKFPERRLHHSLFFDEVAGCTILQNTSG